MPYYETLMFLSQKGERYHAFFLKKILYIEELKCTLREIVHEPSGAEIIHLENDDPENLFCLSFKTLPYNSNGVAHILEHTVLCGSKKYPVKDPFFAMTRRSLHTFMNALTGPDFTCYPAASQVEKDFYNLMEVYIDAVFHPQLKKLSFLQEGHRLEFTEPANPFSDLQRKGIVLNEMKGSFNSSETRIWHEMMDSLVPDLPYAYVSGGDPKEIPKLTYEELVKFHEDNYHPSRCLFFFYGNFPLQKHLDFIEEKALKDVEKLGALPPAEVQKRFKKPVHKEAFYPVSETEDLNKKEMVVFGWLTVPIHEQETMLALNVIDAILMETDASLLRLPLLQSGLCVSADAYIDTEMSEIPYVLICKGCRKEDAPQLEELLRKTLKDIIETGIPSKLIESAIHQLEFARTEITGDHAPFGLTLFMRAALGQQHGCPPENALVIHTLFNSLLEKTKDPCYLTGLIDRYLLSNTHFVRLIMRPDPQLTSQELQKEKQDLKDLKKTLSQEEMEAIVDQAQKLAQYQQEEEEQSIECLPKVEIDDIPKEVKDFPLKEKGNVLYHPCFTNQIIYADLVFDLPELEESDFPYVQILSGFLSELGSGKRNYVENLEYLQAYTAGVMGGFSLNPHVDNVDELSPFFMIRGKALGRNASSLFSIMKEMATSFRLDEKRRIEELMLQMYANLENRLNRSALRYANQLALSGFSSVGKVNYLCHGLSFFKKVQEIVESFSHKGLDIFIERLMAVRDKIFTFSNPRLILSCDDAMAEELEKEKYFGLLDLPTKAGAAWKGSLSLSVPPSQAIPIASPLAFNCLAYKVPPYLHPHAPALSLASHLIDNKILHPLIREQGGAYGCGATYGGATGSFTLHSYRDPHIANTLKIFEQSIEAIAKGDFDERDLEDAKLEVVQQLDTPVSAGSRSFIGYVWDIEKKTKEKRQKFRKQLISLTKKEVMDAVSKELLPQKGEGVFITFGGKQLLEKENEILGIDRKPLPINPV